MTLSFTALSGRNAPDELPLAGLLADLPLPDLCSQRRLMDATTSAASSCDPGRPLNPESSIAENPARRARARRADTSTPMESKNK